MSISITPVNGNKSAANGLSVTWDGGQFVMIIADKGLVACGIVDFEVALKFNFAIAIAHGSPEKPLVTAEDLLEAKVTEVTEKARELGVKPGMTGREALDKLTS
jgi:uncharacterized protein YunC (DUF1805 family)